MQRRLCLRIAVLNGKVRALPVTRLSATVAGVWCALGASLADRWASGPLSYLARGLVMVVCFLVPVLLFVVGMDHIRRWKRGGLRHPYRHRRFDRRYWNEAQEVGLRAVCWFVGAVASAVLYSIVVSGRWPTPLD